MYRSLRHFYTFGSLISGQGTSRLSKPLERARVWSTTTPNLRDKFPDLDAFTMELCSSVTSGGKSWGKILGDPWKLYIRRIVKGWLDNFTIPDGHCASMFVILLQYSENLFKILHEHWWDEGVSCWGGRTKQEQRSLGATMRRNWTV